VLDLAIGRKMLRKLALGERRDRRIGVEKNGPRRGRALVDRQHIGCHPIPPQRGRAAVLLDRRKQRLTPQKTATLDPYLLRLEKQFSSNLSLEAHY
jgi:hypothetical protein